MQLIWLGHSCFKIITKETTIITDPYDDIGLKLPSRLNADIVTVSHDHHDHNNIGAISGSPLVIKTPGEYETKGIFIQGIPSSHDEKNGSERGANTIFLFTLEDMKLAHLGDQGTVLTDDQLEKLEGVDILMIPVGGIYTVDAKKAAEVVNQIEPRLVIPMHYAIPGLKIKLNPVNKFCDEMGTKTNGAEDRLKISKKDLPVEETKVIILKNA